MGSKVGTMEQRTRDVVTESIHLEPQFYSSNPDKVGWSRIEFSPNLLSITLTSILLTQSLPESQGNWHRTEVVTSVSSHRLQISSFSWNIWFLCRRKLRAPRVLQDESAVSWQDSREQRHDENCAVHNIQSKDWCSCIPPAHFSVTHSTWVCYRRFENQIKWPKTHSAVNLWPGKTFSLVSSWPEKHVAEPLCSSMPAYWTYWNCVSRTLQSWPDLNFSPVASDQTFTPQPDDPKENTYFRMRRLMFKKLCFL